MLQVRFFVFYILFPLKVISKYNINELFEIPNQLFYYFFSILYYFFLPLNVFTFWNKDQDKHSWETIWVHKFWLCISVTTLICILGLPFLVS